MTINAKEKVFNAIEKNVKDLKFEIFKIEDLKEAKKFLGSIDGSSELLMLNFATKISLEVRKYENGCELVSFKIFYDKSKVPYEPKDVTILTSGNRPIIEIFTVEEDKSLEQLIAITSPNQIVSNKLTKDVKVTTTAFAYGNGDFESTIHSYLTTYRNLKDNKIMLQHYNQYYGLTENILLELCGHGARILEIIYSEGNPLYCELSNKYSVTLAGYRPYNQSDVETCISDINAEYDELIRLINNTFTKGPKKTRKFSNSK